MNRLSSTRGWPIRTAGLLLLAGLLLWGLPAAAQAIKVTSAVPNAADQGTVGLVVTIGGENFGKGSKVNFYVTGTTNPGGIAVRNVNYKNPQTLEATIDVAPDAQTDLKFDIQVMSNGRTGKGTELFKVNVKTTCTDRPIVYHVNGGRGRQDLMLMAEDGTCQQLLLAGSRNVWHANPVWAPGSEWIAFKSNWDGYGIWVIKKDGTAPTKVANVCNSDSINRLSWRPVTDNGTSYWIAYPDTCGQSGDAQDLWAVEVSLTNPALGTPVCLTCEMNADGSTYWSDVAWSPSGMYLAANRLFDGGTYIWWPLYIFKAAFDSGQPSLVVDPAWPWPVPPPQGQTYTNQVSWAHWGDSLAVKAGPSGDLWRLDLDIENRTVLNYEAVTEGSDYKIWSPRWSPNDDRFIAEIGIPGQLSTDRIAIISLPLNFTSIQRGGRRPDWRP